MRSRGGYPHTGVQGFKARFIYLVGQLATRAELNGSEAYSVAYGHLYDLLPECKRGCACTTFQHPGQENLIA